MRQPPLRPEAAAGRGGHRGTHSHVFFPPPAWRLGPGHCRQTRLRTESWTRGRASGTCPACAEARAQAPAPGAVALRVLRWWWSWRQQSSGRGRVAAGGAAPPRQRELVRLSEGGRVLTHAAAPGAGAAAGSVDTCLVGTQQQTRRTHRRRKIANCAVSSSAVSRISSPVRLTCSTRSSRVRLAPCCQAMQYPAGSATS